jgi:HEPN domain-containing protein
LTLGGEGWGHSITRLLNDLEQRRPISRELIQAAQRLDKHYIPTRCPNGFDVGAPRDYYTAGEAERAISDVQRIFHFCQQSIR